MSKTKLRLATRSSPLALAQASEVQQRLLAHHPSLDIDIISMTTFGDEHLTTALQDSGGKAVFVKELQQALLNNDADFAVHSIKDMSVFPCQGLTLAAICERASANDVLVTTRYNTLDDLPTNAIIGTSSPRRQSQIKAHLPHCETKLCRGNVNSRLAHLHAQQYDGIILAQAGLTRLGINDQISTTLPINDFIPAIGQGALGIECRANDPTTQAYLTPLNHFETACCVTAERTVNVHLKGDCYTPIAAHAQIQNQKLQLNAMVGSLDGQTIVRASSVGSIDKPEQLGKLIAFELLELGAQAILDACADPH